MLILANHSFGGLCLLLDEVVVEKFLGGPPYGSQLAASTSD